MNASVRGRIAVLVAAVVVSASSIAMSGCADVRNGLGTSSGVCFRAIPVGRSALGNPEPADLDSTASTKAGPSPVFIGVRSASQKDIDAFGKTHDYYKSVLTARNGAPLKSVCLVGFRGSFDPTQVRRLLGSVPSAGDRKFAVVVVSEPSNEVLATFIRSRIPISFSHYVVGGG